MLEGLTFGIMRKMHILFIFTLLVGQLMAQDNEEVILPTKEKHSYLIIPNDPKLYISSADKYIAQKTGLSHIQIREGFRHEMVKQLMADFSKLGKVQTLLADTGEVHQDLIYTYHSVGYKYEEVPAEETEVKSLDKTKDKVNKTLDKLLPNRAQKEETEELGPKTEEKEHYMKTSIHSPYLLYKLNETYGTNRFIFINQFDIKDEPKSTYSYGKSDYIRVMRVHYTIIDIDGNIITSGLAKKEFTANLNNPEMIVKLTMPSISYFILQKFTEEDTKDKSTLPQNELEKY